MIFYSGTPCLSPTTEKLWINVNSWIPLELSSDAAVDLCMHLTSHGPIATPEDNNWSVITCDAYDSLLRAKQRWTTRFNLSKGSPLKVPAEGKTCCILGRVVGYKNCVFSVEMFQSSYCDRGSNASGSPAVTPTKKFKFKKQENSSSPAKRDASPTPRRVRKRVGPNDIKGLVDTDEE